MRGRPYWCINNPHPTQRRALRAALLEHAKELGPVSLLVGRRRGMVLKFSRPTFVADEARFSGETVFSYRLQCSGMGAAAVRATAAGVALSHCLSRQDVQVRGA